MPKVQMFKAAKDTKRFKRNQKVWVSYLFSNHMRIYYKYRGSGRWVRGVIDRGNTAVGEIHEVEVDNKFAREIEAFR